MNFCIVTRTSGRPSYFKICSDSIKQQIKNVDQNVNIRHIVSVDDDKTYKYVKALGYTDHDIVKVKRTKRIHAYHNPYNLYMNDLILRANTQKPCWIVFLDDDNKFENEFSIHKIVQNIRQTKNSNNMYIWKLNWINGIHIPTDKSFGKSITQCDIDTNCLMIHSDFVGLVKWDSNRMSDYRFAKSLSRQSNIKLKWIDQVITTIQGNKAGVGQRNDI